MELSSNTTISYLLVDAFTKTSFKGNTAAVVFLDPTMIQKLSDQELQSIASEFNLAETAFVSPTLLPISGKFNLRWFTPSVEYPLCGHATLATATALFSSLLANEHFRLDQAQTEVGFETLSGTLYARKLEDGRIELEFPGCVATPVEEEESLRISDIVARALKNPSDFELTFIGKGSGLSFGKYVLIEIRGVELEQITLETRILNHLRPTYEVIIFTNRAPPSDPTFSFYSRVFCPLETDPEDSVTGSAHCVLGPYWFNKLAVEETVEIFGKQVSKRTGEVGIVLRRDGDHLICKLRGDSVIISKGEILYNWGGVQSLMN